VQCAQAVRVAVEDIKMGHRITSKKTSDRENDFFCP